jgi:hypothetical protein
VFKKNPHTFVEIKIYSIPHLGDFMKTPLNFAEIAFAQATYLSGSFWKPLELRGNAKVTVNFRIFPPTPTIALII